MSISGLSKLPESIQGRHRNCFLFSLYCAVASPEHKSTFQEVSFCVERLDGCHTDWRDKRAPTAIGRIRTAGKSINCDAKFGRSSTKCTNSGDEWDFVADDDDDDEPFHRSN